MQPLVSFIFHNLPSLYPLTAFVLAQDGITLDCVVPQAIHITVSRAITNSMRHMATCPSGKCVEMFADKESDSVLCNN